MSEDVSAQVVEQRVRNRMIEYWEWVSSSTAQSEYQQRVSYVSVSNEAINQWEDCQVYESPVGHYRLPVFTEEEAAMLERFNGVWNEVAEATPDPLPPLEELAGNHHWKLLIQESKAAYDLFMIRGKLDEDNPIQNKTCHSTSLTRRECT
tara:strand:- start:600 stop:1049 length:450 start_codon:yes stop_codon:yes gene_type:complete